MSTQPDPGEGADEDEAPDASDAAPDATFVDAPAADRPGARPAAVLLSALLALVVWAGLVRLDTATKDATPPAKTSSSEGAPTPAGDAPPATADAPATEDSVEERLLAHPTGAIVLVVLRFVPAVAGVVVLLLYGSRRRAIRRGELPAPARRAPPRPVTSLFGAIGVLVLWIAAQGGGFALALRLGIAGAEGSANRLTASLLVSALAGLLVGIPIALARRSAGPPPSVSSRLSAAFRVFLAGSAVTLALGLVATLLLSWMGRTAPPQELVRTALESPPATFYWALGILGVLVVPFAEEAVFRGMLYPAARRIAGPLVGAIAISILFAAIHMSAAAYLPLLGLALLLAGLYEATGSLLAVTVVHALNNACTIVPLIVVATT